MRSAETAILPASDASIGQAGRFVSSVRSALPRSSRCGRRDTDTVPPAPRRRLQVVGHGAGDDPDPVARRVHPPAEVDVLAEQRHRGVEAADLVPDIPADQHPGAADGQRVLVTVVLALVHLAGLDAGDPAADRVDGYPGLQDHLPVGPVHDLRAEHGGRLDLGRAAEQLLQRVRGRLAVVVQQPDPLGPLRVRDPGRAGHRHVRRTVLQCAGYRCRVAGAALHAEHDRLAELAGQHGAAPVLAAGVDRDNPLNRAGLAEQGTDDMRQPGGAIVRDDYRCDDMLRVRIVRRQGSVCSSGGLARGAGTRVGGTVPAGPGYPLHNTRRDDSATARRRASP